MTRFERLVMSTGLAFGLSLITLGIISSMATPQEIANRITARAVQTAEAGK